MGKSVQVVARRGDVENAPENSLPAFESAINIGADRIELDVHATADGHLIIQHYYNLGSTDNGIGLVGEKSLSELRALDSGAWFSHRYAGITKPTLAEVLELCRGRVGLEIDLKSASLDFLKRVVQEIEDFGLTNDIELTTAHIPMLTYLKNWRTGFKIGTFFLEPAAWMPLRLAQQHAIDWATLLQIDAVHLHISLITPDFVQNLHQCGFAIHGSNLDTKEDILQGIHSGIDAFSTGHLKMALQARDQTETATW